MTRRFFSGGPSVELYDLRLTELARPVIEGDIEFYRRAARRAGGPVLELGCGTGRVAIPIAAAGHEVVGLDLSAAMLRIARSKARALPRGARIRFVRGDMERFRIRRRFRLAIIPFRSFHALMTPAAQRRSLDCIRRHLAPGGRLVIHLFDPLLEYCLPASDSAPRLRDAVVDPRTGRRFEIRVLDRRNDPLAQTFRETWRWTERDRRGRVIRRHRSVMELRWTYRWEMRYLLDLAGFEVLACLGDFRKGPPRYGSEQIWVARKR